MQRKIAIAVVLAGLAGGIAGAEDEAPVPEPMPIGTMSELMIKLMYPASDAILYVESRAPTNEVEWNELQAQALLLAESANLIMMPSRVAGDRDEWMRDARLMFDAGAAAYEAALDQDLEALIALNEQGLHVLRRVPQANPARLRQELQALRGFPLRGKSPGRRGAGSLGNPLLRSPIQPWESET